MERLTENFRGMGNCGITKHAMTSDGKANLSRFADKVITKLADYEDAEEQGFLLRLPCKVGDTVYYLYNKHILKDTVETIKIKETYNRDGIIITIKTVADDYFYIENFGKTVFLTKEEAERELKRMESE